MAQVDARVTHELPAEEEQLVQLNLARVHYQSPDAPCLQDIHLSFRPGEFILMIGTSGSGKSTLAYCLNGIVPHIMGHYDGQVVVGGAEVAKRPMAENAQWVGLVMQDPESQLCNLYVKHEVAFGPENLALPREQVQERLEESIRFVGLQGLEDRFVFGLSGGQKQKVAIASVIAMRPKLIIFDEPTANLDPLSSQEILELIDQLRREGIAVLVIETKVDQFATLADRVIAVHEGRIVAEGTPQEIFSGHGRQLSDDCGIWVPQVSEVELKLRAAGLAGREFPVSVEQAGLVYQHYRFGPVAKRAAATPPAGAQPLIRVKDLRYIYDDGHEALKGVNMTVHKGEWLAIVGPNGSGKTTLIKHLVGLLKASSGEVEVAGQDVRRVTVRELVREIGFVFQYPEHQFVKDTVQEELALSLRLQNVPEAEIEERAREAVEIFQLAGLEKRHPLSLSGGEKRRLSVATVLITRPRVVILDEPTYAQDKHSTQQMMDAILNLLGRGDESERSTCLIMVTHDMRLVAQYADRALVMSEGRVAFDGRVDGLFAQPDLIRRVHLEYPPIQALVTELRNHGATVPDGIVTVEDFVQSVLNGR